MISLREVNNYLMNTYAYSEEEAENQKTRAKEIVGFASALKKLKVVDLWSYELSYHPSGIRHSLYLVQKDGVYSIEFWFKCGNAIVRSAEAGYTYEKDGYLGKFDLYNKMLFILKSAGMDCAKVVRIDDNVDNTVVFKYNIPKL